MSGDDSATGRAILREAGRHAMLERHEEQDLARRAGAGDGEATRRLVGSHLRFVIKVARPYRRLGLPTSDLLQEGTLGLVRAVRRFDPNRGVRLSTYAMWWIRAAIQDYVQRSWSMVQSGAGGPPGGRGPAAETDAEPEAADPPDAPWRSLAGRFGARTSGMASRARRLMRAEPRYDRRTGEAEEPLEAVACEAPTPEQWLAALSQQRFARRTLASAIGALTPRERFVIRKRYLEDARPTFAAIGRELGVSKDRVRQLEANALNRLRKLLGPVATDLT